MTTVQLITLFLALFLSFFSGAFTIILVKKIRKSKRNIDSNYTSITIATTLWILSILLVINYCLIMI